MRCLITGGAGFIGSHLSEALLAQGEEVFVLDDLSTGSVENIRHLKTNNRFHYIFDSIMNKHLLAELVDESDVIFHLAAAVGVRLIVVVRLKIAFAGLVAVTETVRLECSSDHGVHPDRGRLF